MPLALDTSITDLRKLREYWKDKEESGEFVRGGKKFQSNIYQIKKEGEFEIRVLGMLRYQTGSHWGVLEGKDGKNGPPIRCPRIYDNSHCPVCEYIDEAERSKDQGRIEEVSRMIARPRHPMIVVDMDEAKKTGVAIPKLYEAPVTVYFAILESSSNSKYDFGNFMDMKKGRNICIVRSKGRNGFVEYRIVMDPNSSALEYELEEMPDTDALLIPRSAEDIEYAMQNGEYPEQPEEKKEEPVKPKAYARGLPSTKTREEPKRTRPEIVSKAKPVVQEELERDEEFIEKELVEVEKEEVVINPPRNRAMSPELRKKLDAIKRTR